MNSRALHRPDYVYLSIVAILIVFGLVMLSSAGAVLGFQRFGDSNYFLKKQALSVLLGVIAFFITFRLDYRNYRRWAVPMLMVTIFALILVFIPGIGPKILGARRWINLGPMLFQPSELAKLTFLPCPSVSLPSSKT